MLEDGPAKQKLIDEMVHIARVDAPWTMGFYPYASAAVQQWVHNSKPAILVRDQGRYLRLDVDKRVAATGQWNRPVWWPMTLIGLVVLALIWVARRSLKQRERTNARGQEVVV